MAIKFFKFSYFVWVENTRMPWCTSEFYRTTWELFLHSTMWSWGLNSRCLWARSLPHWTMLLVCLYFFSFIFIVCIWVYVGLPCTEKDISFPGTEFIDSCELSWWMLVIDSRSFNNWTISMSFPTPNSLFLIYSILNKLLIFSKFILVSLYSLPVYLGIK